MENIQNQVKAMERIVALEQEVKRYKKIINHLHAGVQVFDKKGVSQFINEKQRELLGLPDVSTGIGEFNVLTDAFSQANGVTEIYKEAYQGKAHEHIFEYDLGIEENKWQTRRDKRRFQEKIIPIKNENGQVECVMAIVEDVTEKETIHQNLINFELRYKDLVNHTPDILYRFSSKRGGLFWSRQVQNILGFTPEEVKKEPYIWLNSIHPEDRPQVDEAIKNFEKGTTYSIDYRIKTKAGEWIWLHDYFMHKHQLGDEIIIEGHASEITKRKELEFALQAEKKRFDLMMEATHDGIWDWNLLNNEIYFSPNWKQMLGYEDHELPNELSVWEQLTHPDDVKAAWDMIHEHIEGKRDRYEIEFRMKHKNGNWIQILSRGNAYFNANGKAERMVGTHVNVSERKNIKKAVEDHEMRWKFAVEGNKDGLWDWNLKTNEVYFSSQWKKMLGFEDHEISGSLEEWEKRVHPDDLDLVYDDIKKHLNGETELYKNEHRVLCKNGKYKWILDRGGVIERDNHNEPMRMIGTHADISDRKMARQMIEASQLKFKTIFEIIDVGISLTDEEGNIIDCNHKSEQILGITKAEHLARNYAGKEWEILRPDHTVMPSHEFTSVRALQQKATLLNEEMGIVKPDGITWISVSASPVNIEGYGVLIAYVDITELKDNEQKLKELNKTKDKIFSIISHDLRNPFNSIVGLNEIVLKCLQENNCQEALKITKVLHQTSQQALNVLNNLLFWSRLQTGRLEFNPKLIKLQKLVAKVHSVLKTSLLEKNLTLKVAIEPDMIFEADEVMLSTIIRNLLSNAIKYSYTDDEIRFSAIHKNNTIQIAIADNGVGIEDMYLNSLFSEKPKDSKPGTNEEIGTGLGLLLCKEFVEKHKGKIWAENNKTQGATFYFTMG